MEFKPRKIDNNAPPTPGNVPLDANPKPLQWQEADGSMRSILPEQFKSLSENEKRQIMMQVQKNRVGAPNAGAKMPNGKSGFKPVPALVTLMPVKPHEMDEIKAISAKCPAKLKSFEDFSESRGGYLARYIVMNGEEEQEIRNFWNTHWYDVQFIPEIDFGVTPSSFKVSDGPQGTTVSQTSLTSPNMQDSVNVSKPCVGCQDK